MYASPPQSAYVWLPGGHPLPPTPVQPLPVALPADPSQLPAAAPAFGGGWVYIPHPAPQSLPQPLPVAPVLHPPGSVPHPALVPVPGYPPQQVASDETLPSEPSVVVGTRPGPAAPRGVLKQGCPGSTVTIPDCDKTWLDPETGAVNVRALLLKSRDIRRKLRAALYHAGRPQYRLSANERDKASRCSEYAALMRAIDDTARECGMLPCTEEMTLAHADALSVLLRRGSADSTSSTDKPSGEPREEPQPASWSLEGMRDVFLVTPGAAGLGSADEHFAAAHELYHRTHGAGAVTDRAEIFAVLYRKFVIAAAAHIVALRNHRN